MFMITSYDESLINNWKARFNIDITHSNLLRVKAEKTPLDIAAFSFLPKIRACGKVKTSTRKLVSESVWRSMEKVKKIYQLMERNEHKLRDEQEPWEKNSGITTQDPNPKKALFSFSKLAMKSGGKKTQIKKIINNS